MAGSEEGKVMTHKYLVQLPHMSTFEVETDTPLSVKEGLILDGQCYEVTYIQRGLVKADRSDGVRTKYHLQIPVVFCALPPGKQA